METIDTSKIERAIERVLGRRDVYERGEVISPSEQANLVWGGLNPEEACELVEQYDDTATYGRRFWKRA